MRTAVTLICLALVGCAPASGEQRFRSAPTPEPDEDWAYGFEADPKEIASASLACIPDDNAEETGDSNSTLACGLKSTSGEVVKGRYEAGSLIATTTAGAEEVYESNGVSVSESVFRYRYLVPLARISDFHSLVMMIKDRDGASSTAAQAVDQTLAVDARRENEQYVKFADPAVMPAVEACPGSRVWTSGECHVFDVRDEAYLKDGTSSSPSFCNEDGSLRKDANECHRLNSQTLRPERIGDFCDGTPAPGGDGFVENANGCFKLKRI